ncbi:g2973 [Coccomyxa viridis]|uniref:G2973 protein n=1 Tax=Coccomyxa viridis TaxID=1274662 RepID=A0ABP1FLP0_9CHLO
MQGALYRQALTCHLRSQQLPSHGLCSNRRPRTVLSIRAAFGTGHGDSVGPSAPPLPRELRTSERVNYPEVYSDSQDITGAPGTRQEQRSVSDSVFSTDQTQDQEGYGTQYEVQNFSLPSTSRREEQQQQQPIQGLSASAVFQRIPQTRWARPALGALGLLLAGSLLLSMVRIMGRFNSPKAKRRRTVDLNKTVVDTLDSYLPTDRMGLTTGVVRGLRMKTGFTATEIFRKYLWYLLRERKFDEDAVADLSALRSVLAMRDDEVAEALRERAQRIYEKYGNVMLETEGMTKAGIERKATCRALFSKLLYLAESDKILAQDSAVAEKLRLPDIFGATEDDTNSLRIVSLYEVDLDNLEGQFES